MQVVKRNGEKQDIDFEKIHWRIKSMCAKPNILRFQKERRPEAYEISKNLPEINHADVDMITKKTFEGVYDKIPTTEIDQLSAEIAHEMITSHPDNSELATRILVSNLQKNTLELLCKIFPDHSRSEIRKDIFTFTMHALYMNKDQKGFKSPLVAPYVLAIAYKYKDRINEMIDYSRDFTNLDYLGFKLLEKGYLFKFYELDGLKERLQIIERPSVSEMRIAIGIVCAPIPYTEPFPSDRVLEFIHDNPELIKDKYRSEGFLRDLYASEEPHKHKCIDQKNFYLSWWNNEYHSAYNNINLTDEDWNRIKEIYDGMSLGRFTPATPTRFNAGTLRPQGSSCFLIAMESDSLPGIYNTLNKQAQISKYAGGIGLWVHNIRSTGSYIAGTNGISNGLLPMLKVFNSTAKYVDQGGNKRPGSISVYLEPWHADILGFLELKRNLGSDDDHARALFYALWIPDEFFRCLNAGKDWYLFDPAIVPKLFDSYDEGFSKKYLSDEFVKENKKDYLFTYRYRKYICQGKYVKKIDSYRLLEEIVITVKDTGVPYMCSKDAGNRKSNQKNLGVIKSSNLCNEIYQYSDSKETSTCNLHSVCLNRFLKFWDEKDGDEFKYNVSLIDDPNYLTFDWDSFSNTVRICLNNIDRLIDFNFYPTECSKRSNTRHRPTATGIQGESDLMAQLRLKWNSKEANRLRFYIFERMYYECLRSSIELAKKNGPYSSFEGSPASQGLLQFDLWMKEGRRSPFPLSLDWDELKDEIQRHGLRNSLFMANMPTGSTSGIMGNSPCFEPFKSLVYIRKAGTGDIPIVNKYLVRDLMELGLWDKEFSDKLLLNHGSIQDFLELPKVIRDSYMTAYDLEPKDIIDAAYVRGWFVDQSQSMNLFIKNLSVKTLSQAWTRAWARGLKTLSYYCHTRKAAEADKAQISIKKEEKKEERIPGVCYRDDPDCLACGS